MTVARARKLGKAATWNDLANLWDMVHPTPARVMPMAKVFEWAEKQKHIFTLHEESLYFKEKRK